jgi:hypothetical protein
MSDRGQRYLQRSIRKISKEGEASGVAETSRGNSPNPEPPALPIPVTAVAMPSLRLNYQVQGRWNPRCG